MMDAARRDEWIAAALAHLWDEYRVGTDGCPAAAGTAPGTRPKRLGEGGAGVVFVAAVCEPKRLESRSGVTMFERELPRACAVKLVFPDSGMTESERRGVELIGQGRRHRHLLRPVCLIDLPAGLGGFAYLMPLGERTAAGQPIDLERHRVLHGMLPAADAKAIIVPLVDACVTLRDQGLAHQDLRLGNFIRVGGVWMITDFSLLVAERTDGDDAGLVRAAHLPPGDARGLARTLYSLITGLGYEDFPNLPVEKPWPTASRQLFNDVVFPAARMRAPTITTVNELRAALDRTGGGTAADPESALRDVVATIDRLAARRRAAATVLAVAGSLVWIAAAAALVAAPGAHGFASSAALAAVAAAACWAYTRPEVRRTLWPSPGEMALRMDRRLQFDNLVFSAYRAGSDPESSPHVMIRRDLAYRAAPALAGYSSAHLGSQLPPRLRRALVASALAALLLLALALRWLSQPGASVGADVAAAVAAGGPGPGGTGAPSDGKDGTGTSGRQGGSDAHPGGGGNDGNGADGGRESALRGPSQGSGSSANSGAKPSGGQGSTSQSSSSSDSQDRDTPPPGPGTSGKGDGGAHEKQRSRSQPRGSPEDGGAPPSKQAQPSTPSPSAPSPSPGREALDHAAEALANAMSDPVGKVSPALSKASAAVARAQQTDSAADLAAAAQALREAADSATDVWTKSVLGDQRAAELEKRLRDDAQAAMEAAGAAGSAAGGAASGGTAGGDSGGASAGAGGRKAGTAPGDRRAVGRAPDPGAPRPVADGTALDPSIRGQGAGPLPSQSGVPPVEDPKQHGARAEDLGIDVGRVRERVDALMYGARGPTPAGR